MKQQHVFHTRHDFSPASAMEVAKIIGACQGSDGINTKKLTDLARLFAFPISRRQNLNKVLASFCDLGLLEQENGAGSKKGFSITDDFRQVMEGPGRWQSGFNAVIHARYFWNWGPEQSVATPCWSYRTACRVIMRHHSHGIGVDDLVVAVVEEAGRVFDVQQVSFSASSVKGILHWLESQAVPLALIKNRRICINSQPDRSEDTVLALIFEAMRRHGSPLALDPPLVNEMATALLIPNDLALEIVRRVVFRDQTLLWFDDSPPVILNPRAFLP